MNRRAFLSLTTAAALLVAGPAFADFEAQVRKQLKQQGYKQIEVSSTLLGRTRIFATKKDGSREIILNPRTGEILRDMWSANGGGDSGPQIAGSDDTPSDDGSSDDGGSDDGSSDDGGSDDGSSDDGGSDDGGSDDGGSDDSGKGGGEDGGNDNSGKDGGDDSGED